MSNQQRDSSRGSSSSSDSDIKGNRTRFAQATTVISPIDPSKERGRSPFADPPDAAKQAQHQIADVGFGYVADNDPARHAAYPPFTPASPLKSALKTPGTLNPLSPTFRQEVVLEIEEKKTRKDNARDIVSSMPFRSSNRFLTRFPRESKSE